MDENENVAEQATPTPLAEILNPQDATPEPAPEPEPEVEEKAEPETVEDPGETASPEGEEKPEEPEPEKPKEEPWTKAAVLEERRKRQEMERQLADLQQKVNQPKDEPAPDPYEDPEAWAKYQDDRLKAVEERTSASVQEAVLRVSRSHVAKEVGEEVLEEAAAAFEMAAAKNPSLIQDALGSDSPYQFVFETGKAELERQAMGDPQAYAAKVAEEAMKKAQAEIDKRVEEGIKAELAKHLPQSLAEEQSQGERATTQPQWDGPKPISQILEGRRK